LKIATWCKKLGYEVEAYVSGMGNSVERATAWTINGDCAEAVIVTKKIVGIKLEGLAQKSAPDIEQNDGISRAKTGAKTLARQAIASQVR
jgi:hypothetical protein